MPHAHKSRKSPYVFARGGLGVEKETAPGSNLSLLKGWPGRYRQCRCGTGQFLEDQHETDTETPSSPSPSPSPAPCLFLYLVVAVGVGVELVSDMRHVLTRFLRITTWKLPQVTLRICVELWSTAR